MKIKIEEKETRDGLQNQISFSFDETPRIWQSTPLMTKSQLYQLKCELQKFISSKEYELFKTITKTRVPVNTLGIVYFAKYLPATDYDFPNMQILHEYFFTSEAEAIQAHAEMKLGYLEHSFLVHASSYKELEIEAEKLHKQLKSVKFLIELGLE